MGVQDNNTLLIQVDFEVFGHVQGNCKINTDCIQCNKCVR